MRLRELIGVDFEAMRPETLYRASDALLKHQDAIEQTLFGRIADLFGFVRTITLFDLTNTYFEGEVSGNAKAQRGHSKERRTDCPLLTLALVLDGSGFVCRSRVFAGNAAEAPTLRQMIEGLKAGAGDLVVMDRGIATEENLAWLRERGYRYLVVSRKRRQFDPTRAQPIETASGQTVSLQKTVSEDGREVRLYCYSEVRGEKERAIEKRFADRFEAGLKALAAGLTKPRGCKGVALLQERIGRLKARCQGAGRHYQVEITPDREDARRATAITWTHAPAEGSRQALPGVYCLRTNWVDQDAETLWRTYTLQRLHCSATRVFLMA